MSGVAARGTLSMALLSGWLVGEAPAMAEAMRWQLKRKRRNQRQKLPQSFTKFSLGQRLESLWLSLFMMYACDCQVFGDMRGTVVARGHSNTVCSTGFCSKQTTIFYGGAGIQDPS
eukprot:4376662-Amphidinium_carterae.1